jgi:tRNA-dihydrouridine synthase B
MLAFGRVAIPQPLVLAPMAGVTDRDFRLIVRRVGGVGLVTMEFIASRALVRGVQKTLDLMHFVPEERPISIQIYGSDPDTMAEAARQVEAMGADLCDINMGCPANKILKGCSGCALMADPELARRIVATVRAAISIPLTVKFRLGLHHHSRNFLELGRICEGEGADGVALHARTAKQMFSGEARLQWPEIARLKETVSIPVVGNGDVKEPQDALDMFASTGCDGVMIGRAATKNPWIFRQTADMLAGRAPETASLLARRDLILDHFQLVAAREESKWALHKLRKFTGWYTHGVPHGKELRARINELGDVPSFLAAVEAFFDEMTGDRAPAAGRGDCFETAERELAERSETATAA